MHVLEVEKNKEYFIIEKFIIRKVEIIRIDCFDINKLKGLQKLYKENKENAIKEYKSNAHFLLSSLSIIYNNLETNESGKLKNNNGHVKLFYNREEAELALTKKIIEILNNNNLSLNNLKEIINKNANEFI